MGRTTEITLVKGPGTRYHALVDRTDGVQVRLEGGSWNRIGGRPGRVPHDIAHLVVEEAFGLERGLWGVLAAGGTVQNASVVAGRKPPHAARRAEAITAPARPMLQQSEVLVRAMADLSLAGRPRDAAEFCRVVGERHAVGGVTPERLGAIDRRLRLEATAWAAVSDGGTHVLRWPGG